MLQKLILLVSLFTNMRLEATIEECAFKTWLYSSLAFGWVQQCEMTIKDRKFELQRIEMQELDKRSERDNKEIQENLEAIKYSANSFSASGMLSYSVISSSVLIVPKQDSMNALL